jgi:hypothetical protein
VAWLCVVVGVAMVMGVDKPFVFSHSGGTLTLFNGKTRLDYDLEKRRHRRSHSRLGDVEVDKEFYGQFRCPRGKWIEKYGYTEEMMEEKARLLARFQHAMEACDNYDRPAIRRYVKRHWAYEDPEWVKPLCRDYEPDARNVDHQCVLANVKRNGKKNITEHDQCGRRFKCWPQLMITHEGRFIFRPSYKSGSQSMRDIMRCYFNDFRNEIWPCDNIYPNSRYTLSPEEQTYRVLHMVRHPLKRFTSALIEQYTRWHNPPKKERYRLGLTKWFPLSEKNASSAELLSAFLRDTECNIDHPWWPHSATALWHMTEYEFPDTLFDGTGRVSDIDYVFKIEKFAHDWEEALQEMGLTPKRHCNLVNINRHDDAQHVGPPKEDLTQILLSNRNLLRRFCAIYIADFVCFDYELPEGCRDMLHPEPRVCPL